MAAHHFNNPKYLEIAEAAAKFYYNRDLSKGYSGGSPVDEMQSPDSESAFAFCDLFTTLYEITGKTEYLNYAKEAAANLASWVIPYDYKFPEGSIMSKINAQTTGAVFANTQNTHGAPCLYIHSGDFLLKLFRATGDERYAELLKDITHNVVQYVTTATNQVVPKGKPGAMSERVQIGDWEGKENIGNAIPEEDSNINWETGALLAINQNPGIYLRTDNGQMIVFDHVNVEIINKDKTGLKLKITNNNHKDANVTIFAEDGTQAKKIMKRYAFMNWPSVFIERGKSVSIYIRNDGKLSL
jgi:hypothetical protein